MNTQRKQPSAPAPLRPPVLGSTPAFPHPAKSHAGVTYRAWLAVHAPQEIPAWFQAISNRMPATVVPWDKRPEAAALTSDQRAYIIEWLRDPITDLPGDLAWAQKAVEEYAAYEKIRDEHNMLTRYFTWPWHWADMMIRSEDQTGQANHMRDTMEAVLAQQQQKAEAEGEKVLPQ